MKKFLITLLFILSFNMCFGQEYKDELSVVCFTASFVKDKELKDWKKLSSVNKHTVDIEKNSAVMTTENISVVPTIIIYDNGVLVKKWEANILFELDVDIKEIQRIIDKVIESKF